MAHPKIVLPDGAVVGDFVGAGAAQGKLKARRRYDDRAEPRLGPLPEGRGGGNESARCGEAFQGRFPKRP